MLGQQLIGALLQDILEAREYADLECCCIVSQGALHLSDMVPLKLTLWLACMQIQMHIVQKNIKMFSPYWCALQLLSAFCWAVTISSAIGSVAGIIHDTQGFAAFNTQQ